LRDAVIDTNTLVLEFARAHHLSKRETEVLQAVVVRRLANKEAASELGISYGTIKVYWSRICSKLQCRDAASVLHQLIAHACTRDP
jgi:DNA-binding NarL/FixJ family response regulator